MGRRFATACAIIVAAPMLLLPASLRASDRTLPMQFTLRQEGPAAACGTYCRLFVAATGAITAETPRDFQKFAEGRNLAGATMVLDSDGGSVHGAIKLGRQIRALGLNTTVGRLIDLAWKGRADLRRAKLSGRADCESMCAFVLLGGIERSVPPEARVMVHQIWLGDRRDDPTAASYSAEDLVLVQRDIGKLAQYTTEMGASIEVLDRALRIPPWEPMYRMSQTELRDARVTNQVSVKPAATVAASPSPTPMRPHSAGGVPVTTISERHWAMIDYAGGVALARSQPLTLEGENIGSFDLMVSCGVGNDSYNVSYSERRDGAREALHDALSSVTVSVGSVSAPLKVVSSQSRSTSGELVSYATGVVPAVLIDAFAAPGSHSITVGTRSAGLVTGIRIGNAGAARNLPGLAAVCRKEFGDRAELTRHRTGGAAVER